MTASIAGALMLAVIIALGFNVIMTRRDRLQHESAGATPVISDVSSRVSAGPKSHSF